MRDCQYSIEERFFSKVNFQGPLILDTLCWEWLAYKDKWGYGRIGKSSFLRNYLAHRLSWELHNGTIPSDLLVLHCCDNPSCVNPDHLFLGTVQDNISDMVAKGRNASGTRKLTDEQILLIVNDPRSNSAIAEDYGIHRSLVYQIKNGKAHTKLTNMG